MWLKDLPGQHIQFWVSLPDQRKQLFISIILVDEASSFMANEVTDSRHRIENKSTELRIASFVGQKGC